MKLRSRQRKQVCFCMSKIDSPRISILKKFMQEKKFTDKRISSNSGDTVHGLVLESISEDITDNPDLECSTEDANSLVQLAYSGSCIVTHANLRRLLQLGKQYNIDQLLKLCTDFLLKNLNTESALEFYNLSKDLCHHTQSKISQFIKTNIKSLLNGIQQKGCAIQDLENWFGEDDLNINEIELFEFILKLGENIDQEDLTKLLVKIRYTLLGSDCFNRRVEPAAMSHIDKVEQNVHVKLLKKQLKNARAFYKNQDLDRKMRDCKRVSTRYTKSFRADSHRQPAEVVISLGGWIEEPNGPSGDVEVWDCRTQNWSTSGVRMEERRVYHRMIYLNNKIYMVGGYVMGQREQDSLHMLDLESLVWTELSPMMQPRCYVSLATAGDRLVAVGGHDGLHRHNTAEMYDPATNNWETLPSMEHVRSDAACVDVAGKVYAIGGFDGQQPLNSIEVFDPEMGTWSMSRVYLHTARSGTRAVVLDGRIYVAGGFDGETRLSSVECFSLGPGGVTRHQVPDMATARSNFAMIVVDNQILVAGGYSGPSVTSKCELYSPRSNTWSSTSDMLSSKSALDAVVIPSSTNIDILLGR